MPEIQSMKLVYPVLLIIILPFIARAQCPVIESAMINACATPPSTSEGINEFVLFGTTAAATAGSYTLYYGSNSNPFSSPSNVLSGLNAAPKNGTGTITSTNGCTIMPVTSPATNIPNGSQVIMIPSNFDADYDVTGICGTGTLYVMYLDITAAPSNAWNANGSFANSPTGPRYIQIRNGSNCTSQIQSFDNLWGSSADGNSVWWGGAGGTSYQNNGCSIITPPGPTITPIATGGVCENVLTDTLSFTTTGSPDQYSINWDPAATTVGFIDVANAVLPASPLSFAMPAVVAAGVYNGTITATNTGAGTTSSPQSFSVTVNAPPIITVQPISTTAYYCQNTPVPSISVTALPGSGTISTYQWYLVVGAFSAALPGANSATYTPSSSGLGTLRFFCVVTNSNTCSTKSDTSGAFIISANVAKPVATATVQPDCTTATGTIVITSPVGININYSDGGPYQASNTLTGLGSGTYNITAKNIITGCTSLVTPVTINAVPVPPTAPAATVTVQPDCIITTGTIEVSSPIGANYQYSDGGAYQAGTTFSGLTSGTAYNITVKDITTGCISPALPLNINAIPAAPATPVASITAQPTCTIPTGTITVTAPTGSNYIYSNGGSYQAALTFTSLTPGTTYPVTVTDNTTGCVSAPLNLTIDAIPATPTAIATVQPSCTVNTGTIVVSAPLGANLEYSAGASYQASTTFAGLAAGTTYTIMARDIVTGCISPAASVIVNAIPLPPATPSGTVTVQPTCTLPTGTLIITSPTGVNIEYSTGGAYQASSTFIGLIAGTTYSVTAKNITTGCLSAAAIITVNAIPPPPPAAVASVTVQPTCALPTATIVITSPTGINYEYSTGGAYQAGLTFTGLAGASSSSITVKDILTGCISAALPLSVNAVPAGPATPVATVTVQPTCIATTGTIVITSPTGANIEYSNGGAYQPGTSFTGLTAGAAYNLTAKDVTSGCVSAVASLTVDAIPGVPATPVATVTVQPTCTSPTGTILINSPLGATLQYSDGGAYQAGTSFSGLVPNNYSLTVKDNITGCVSAPLSLTVNMPPPIPAAPVGSDITVCQNKPAGTLSATGASLLWYTAATSGTGTASAPVLSSAAAGNTLYYVSQTVNGCEGPRDTVSVTIKPTPLIPVVTTPLFYCINTPAAQLSATGTNLLWYSGSTGGTGNSTAPTPLTTAIGNSFYYVSQTNNQGCESPRVAITVSVSTVITPVTGFKYSPDTVCKNSAITPGPTFDIGFKTGGIFSSTTGISVNAANGNINLAASTPGTYVITYKYTANGCILGGTSSSSITINPPVSTNTIFSYTSPICKNDPNPSPAFATGFTTGGQFNSGAGLAVNISSGAINLAASNPGIYQVTYSLPTVGCRLATSNFAFVSINANTVPVTGFNYSPAAVCPGHDNPVLMMSQNFNGGGTFSSTPAGLSLDSVSGDIDMTNSIPGGYIVTYSRPKLGCRLPGSSRDTFIIRSTLPPKTSFAYAGPVCKSDSAVLPLPDSSFTIGGVFSSDTSLSINPVSGLVNAAGSLPGLHQIKYVLDPTVCSLGDSSTAPLEIFVQPAPPALSTDPICNAGAVTLKATGSGTIRWYADVAASILLHTGNSYDTTITQIGLNYFLTSAVGSCTSPAVSVIAAISPAPDAPFLGNDTSICKGDVLRISAGNYAGYLWQDGSTAPVYNATVSGTYTVIIKNAGGCTNTGSLNLTIVDNCDDIVFPTAFSPNGDGNNEKFGPLGNLFVVKNYTFTIFNRYGETVFTSNNPYQKWDGMYKGKMFGNTSFVWVASYLFRGKQMKTQKGSVILLR